MMSRCCAADKQTAKVPVQGDSSFPFASPRLACTQAHRARMCLNERSCPTEPATPIALRDITTRLMVFRFSLSFFFLFFRSVP